MKIKDILVSIISILVVVLIIVACAKNQKDYFTQTLFTDGTKSSSGLQLWSLLDNYPAIKSGFSKLQPKDFNNRLNTSLVSNEENITGSLRAIQDTLLSSESQLRYLLRRISFVMERITTGNEDAYNNAVNYFTRMRYAETPFLRAITPVSNAGLHQLYTTRNQDSLENSINKFIGHLEDEDTKDFLKDVEDFIYKANYSNSQTRAGIEEMLLGYLDGDLNSDKFLQKKTSELLGGIGEAILKKSGYNQSKSSNYAIKELFVNLRKYYTTGGSVYDSSTYYNTGNAFTSEFATVLSDLYPKIRNLVVAPSNLVQDSNVSILNLLATNYNKFSFSAEYTGLDSSLNQMIAKDLYGKNRTDVSNSNSVSALESLIFLLSVAENFGYLWKFDGTDYNNPQITGMSNGAITVGDATYQMHSKLDGDPLGIYKVMYESWDKSNDGTYGSQDGDADGDYVVQKDGMQYPVGLNTPALSLLEGESRGAISGANDPVFTKTIPWALAWIAKIAYSGKGPYYNKNRTDASRNILTLDGSVYMDSAGNDKIYKPTWNTANYIIKVKDGNSDGVKDWAGLGGYHNPGGNGTSYTIKEIEKSSSERAVDSDEEAFFKNLQWFLYEKRFVLVIPIQAAITGGTLDGLADAVYATVVANGIKGLMNTKPYCSSTECSYKESGKWIKKGEYVKNKVTSGDTYKFEIGDLTNFSDIPGDSVIAVEVWGYGLASTTYGFTDETAYQQVFWLLFNKYNDSAKIPYMAAIPRVISQNFTVMEQLGFTTDTAVYPSEVSIYWDNRNKLVPLIAALAKSFYDQSYNNSDYTQNTNSFKMLTDLAHILVRPYLFEGVDPVNKKDSSTDVTIKRYLIKASSDTFGIRDRGMESDLYYPEESLRPLLSILIENERRYQDGLLNLVGQTNLISSLGGLLSGLGTAEREEVRTKLFSGLKNFLLQVEVDANATAYMFNISQGFRDLRDSIVELVTNRSADLSDSSWEGVDDVISVTGDLLSVSSVYSIIPTVNDLLNVMTEGNPTESEISSVLDLLTIVLTSSDGTQSYLITDIITSDLPTIINPSKKWARNLLGLLDGLSVEGGFIIYLHASMVSDYHLTAIIDDLKRLLVADMIQTTEKTDNSLFYTAGTLVRIFGDIYEYGKKPSDPGNYLFQDRWNVTEQSSPLFDRFAYILSSHK